MSTPKNQLRTLSKALDVLELVEASPSPISLSELARELDEAGPVIFRILQTMEARGYVRRREDDKRYTHTGRSTGSGSIRRAVHILRCLGTCAQAGCSVPRLAELAGLDEASVQEVLRPLEEAGVVEPGPEAAWWRISYSLMEILRPLLAGDEVVNLARPLMERLQAETGETISLFKQAGSRQVTVIVIPSRHPVRYVLDVGSSFPMHLGAAGKAMLAALPAADLAPLLDHEALHEQRTSYRADPTALRQELEVIRQRGYALSSNERVDGASAVASAVLDTSGRPRGVLSLMLPSFRADEQHLHALGALLKREVDTLWVPAEGRRPELVD